MNSASSSSPLTASRKSRRSPAPRPARVFCRVLTDGEGAEWPLSRKFGCAPQMAVDVLAHAARLGLDAYGVSFHVGSQMTNLDAWDKALADARMVFEAMPKRASR
jgi:ornithine decarboxylase